MGIFDGIMGSIDSLGDALGDLDLTDVGSTALKTLSGSKTNPTTQAESSFNMLETLDRRAKNNIQNLGQPYNVNNFKAPKSQPTDSVDPDTINQQWLRRLDRYSTIPEFQGAKSK